MKGMQADNLKNANPLSLSVSASEIALESLVLAINVMEMASHSLK